MMNGSTSKIHSENPPNSLPKGAKSRFDHLLTSCTWSGWYLQYTGVWL